MSLHATMFLLLLAFLLFLVDSPFLHATITLDGITSWPTAAYIHIPPPLHPPPPSPGALLPIRVESSCHISINVAASHWLYVLKSRRYVELYALVDWEEAEGAGCVTYGDVIEAVEEAFPPMMSSFASMMLEENEAVQRDDAVAVNEAEEQHIRIPRLPHVLFIATKPNSPFPPNPVSDPAYHVSDDFHDARESVDEYDDKLTRVEFVPGESVKEFLKTYAQTGAPSIWGSKNGTQVLSLVDSSFIDNTTMRGLDKDPTLAEKLSVGSPFIPTIHDPSLLDDAAAPWIRAWHHAGIRFARHMMMALCLLAVMASILRSWRRACQDRRRGQGSIVPIWRNTRVLLHGVFVSAALIMSAAIEKKALTKSAVVLHGLAVGFLGISLHGLIIIWIRSCLSERSCTTSRWWKRIILAENVICIIVLDVLQLGMACAQAVWIMPVDVVAVLSWIQFGISVTVFLIYMCFLIWCQHAQRTNSAFEPFPDGFSYVSLLMAIAQVMLTLTPWIPNLLFVAVPSLTDAPKTVAILLALGDAVITGVILVLSATISDRHLSKTVQQRSRYDVDKADVIMTSEKTGSIAKIENVGSTAELIDDATPIRVCHGTVRSLSTELFPRSETALEREATGQKTKQRLETSLPHFDSMLADGSIWNEMAVTSSEKPGSTAESMHSLPSRETCSSTSSVSQVDPGEVLENKALQDAITSQHWSLSITNGENKEAMQDEWVSSMDDSCRTNGDDGHSFKTRVKDLEDRIWDAYQRPRRTSHYRAPWDDND